MKVKETLKNVIRKTMLGIGLYTISLVGVQGIVSIFSPRITTQPHLESKLVEERNKLNDMIPRDVKIEAVLSDSDKNKTRAGKIEYKRYKIILHGICKNESSLRHELYHIADGHLDSIGTGRFVDLLKYFFWYEPKATIYEATRWKMNSGGRR